MDILYPAKHIKRPYFSRKLLIDGDFEDNCILFRFLFDTAEMVHPLLIWVKIQAHRNRSGRGCRERIIAFECNILDYNNPLMKSSLIFPEFLLRIPSFISSLRLSVLFSGDTMSDCEICTRYVHSDMYMLYVRAVLT